MSIPLFSPAAARGVCIGILSIALGACAPQPDVRPAAAAPVDPAAAARAALGRGEHRAAGDAYAALAMTDGADAARRETYGALAALAYQDAGESGQADLVLGLFEDIPNATATPGLATARVCSLLDAGLAEDAHALAQDIDASRLDAYGRGALARCAGLAAWRSGDSAAAARQLVAAYRHAVPAARSAELGATTWRALETLSTLELETSRAASAGGADTAWYALASRVRDARFDAAQLEQTLADWGTSHPGHPAHAVFDLIRADTARLARAPTRIALLLPFDDTLGMAASAIRDGFVLGWSSGTAPRPRLDIYSTSERALHEVVQEAVAAGAEFLVGPLQKELVETLRDDTTLPVPALALNVVDSPGATRPQFFQFGLTPEDEAREVARRALRQGRRALVLAPDTAWGRRLGAAYTAAWSDVDGTLLGVVYYNDRLESYADAIERALNIDLSTARTAALGRHLGLAVVGAPRRRADVDLILLAAFPDDARQVMPQLRYFGAGDLPVFATSHVYAGNLDAERDRDLDGIAFGDMPWLFGAAERELHALVRETWATTATAYARLYAFGIDAYRVLPYLARMRAQPDLRLPGATGTLSMGTPGVLKRQLLWMRFQDGVPRALDAGPPSGDARL